MRESLPQLAGRLLWRKFSIACPNGQTIEVLPPNPLRWSVRFKARAAIISVGAQSTGHGANGDWFELPANSFSDLFKYSDYLTFVQSPWYAQALAIGATLVVIETYMSG